MTDKPGKIDPLTMTASALLWAAAWCMWQIIVREESKA